jgi:hypothetical protein
VRESRVIDVPPMRTFGRMTFKQGRWGQQVGTHPDRIVEVGTTGPVLPGRCSRAGEAGTTVPWGQPSCRSVRCRALKRAFFAAFRVRPFGCFVATASRDSSS